MNTDNNLGQKAIDRVFSDLQIDSEWSIQNDDYFSWIAHRLEQKVQTSAPIESDDILLFRITAETLVLENMKSDKNHVFQIIAEANRNAFGNCYTYYPEENKLYATSFSWIHADTYDWRIKQFESYIIGQLTLAEIEADYLSNRLNADVAIRTHHKSGKREQPDDMLNVIGDLTIPQGQLPSKFADPFELKTIEEIAHQSPYAATLGMSEDGIALESSFGEHTTFSALRPKKRHRLLGNGLTYQTLLPTNVSFEDGCEIVNMLNRKTRDEYPEFHHHGAWCIDHSMDGEWVVSYNGFIPNMFYMSGITMDASYGLINKARWADLTMNFDTSKPDAWEKLSTRMKNFFSSE